MRHLSSKLLIVAVTGAALTACGADNQPTSVPTTPSASSITPFDTTVSINNFSPECMKVKCWLPTQFEPRLVKGQSVSLFNTWPMDGDTVHVLCETVGGTFRDTDGNNVNEWYGIFIPSEMAVMKDHPNLKDAYAKPVEGGFVGYVGKPWLTDVGAIAPQC